MKKNLFKKVNTEAFCCKKNHNDIPVKFESKKDKLQHVDSAEHFQLKGSIMTNAPDADWNRDQTDEDQRYKDQDPNVSMRLEVVRDQ
jgi:hypothetical protein